MSQRDGYRQNMSTSANRRIHGQCGPARCVSATMTDTRSEHQSSGPENLTGERIPVRYSKADNL